IGQRFVEHADGLGSGSGPAGQPPDAALVDTVDDDMLFAQFELDLPGAAPQHPRGRVQDDLRLARGLWIGPVDRLVLSPQPASSVHVHTVAESPRMRPALSTACNFTASTAVLGALG